MMQHTDRAKIEASQDGCGWEALPDRLPPTSVPDQRVACTPQEYRDRVAARSDRAAGTVDILPGQYLQQLFRDLPQAVSAAQRQYLEIWQSVSTAVAPIIRYMEKNGPLMRMQQDILDLLTFFVHNGLIGWQRASQEPRVSFTWEEEPVLFAQLKRGQFEDCDEAIMGRIASYVTSHIRKSPPQDVLAECIPAVLCTIRAEHLELPPRQFVTLIMKRLVRAARLKTTCFPDMPFWLFPDERLTSPHTRAYATWLKLIPEQGRQTRYYTKDEFHAKWPEAEAEAKKWRGAQHIRNEDRARAYPISLETFYRYLRDYGCPPRP